MDKTKENRGKRECLVGYRGNHVAKEGSVFLTSVPLVMRFYILGGLMQSSDHTEQSPDLNVFYTTSGKIGHMHNVGGSFGNMVRQTRCGCPFTSV